MSKSLDKQNLYNYLEKLYNQQDDLCYYETLNLLESIFNKKRKRIKN